MKKFDRLFNTIMEEVKTSRKYQIDESLDEYDYYKLCLNHAKEIANRFINDPQISKVYKKVLKEEVIKQFKSYEDDWDYIHDLDGVAAMICEQRYYIIGWEPELTRFLTTRPGHKFDEKYWIKKYSAEVEGQEGDWYGYLEGDAGFYDNLAPFFKAIADEIYEEYKDVDWANAKNQHKTPMYDEGETDSFHESKKVDTKKKVIKESVKRPVRKHRPVKK